MINYSYTKVTICAEYINNNFFINSAKIRHGYTNSIFVKQYIISEDKKQKIDNEILIKTHVFSIIHVLGLRTL